MKMFGRVRPDALGDHVGNSSERDLSRPFRKAQVLSRRILGVTIAALIFVFLAAPLVVTIASSFSPTEYLAFPPKGLSLRWYLSVFSNADWLAAFRTTLFVTSISVPISLMLGMLAAYAIGRGKFRGQEALSTLFLSPIMVPEAMFGTALLFYFSKIGFLNSMASLVVAHVVVALPYVVRLVLVSVQSLDRSLELAAAVLGASPTRIFLTITAPLMRSGLFAAIVFGIVLSVGELGLTIFLAGPGTTTVPVLVYTRVIYGFDPTITAVSSILALSAFPALFMLDRWVGLEKVF